MTNDLISRQAAVEATWFEPSYTDPLNVLTEVRDRLKDLPSADRPRGEWVEDTYGWVYCSHCKKYLDDYQMVFFLKPFDYCPNCGADMRGGDNEAD